MITADEGIFFGAMMVSFIMVWMCYHLILKISTFFERVYIKIKKNSGI